MLNNRQIAIIHIAKKQLDLEDDEYRKILQDICKVESSKAINSHTDFLALMLKFEEMGFERLDAKNPIKHNHDDLKDRSNNMATAGQLDKVVRLWKKVTYSQDNWETALHKFLQNKFEVSHRRFLTRKKAITVIEAIKEMVLRNCASEIYDAVRYPSSQDFSANKLLHLYKESKKYIHDETFGIIISALMHSDESLFKKIRDAYRVSTKYLGKKNVG